MKKIPVVAVILAWLLIITTAMTNAEETNEAFEISGFARLVGGYLNDSGRHFEGYTDRFSVTEQSLLAIQPSYSFTDKLSFTGQFVAHTNDDQDNGVEWAYLSYRPDNAWHLRAGKLRTPFFIYSDSYNVGYTYPWITAPVQVYNNYLFSNFTGASANYYTAGDSLSLNLEAYYGYFDGDVFLAGNKIEADTEIENLMGLVSTISHNNLSLRLAYHQAYIETIVPEIDVLRSILDGQGFNESAKSLDPKGQVYALQTSLSYDTLNSFYKAEWINIVADLDIAPEVTGYYLMAGHIVNSWTFHLTYGRSEHSDVKSANELPVSPSGNPQLDQLASTYYQIFTDTPNGRLDSYTLGSRWDFRMNMALKADVSLLKEFESDTGFFSNSEFNPNKDAYLYQVAWEWVF